ncbi:hypothetical protein Xen7305DRAFT_00041810 [Xenococcus sp. PCC 7305]|nr:hypothetical protein [Xenococcus sp. PCC 7305]ELS04447.1 hypothetical protein Xen7305DRAFT_00041810 [Xenococcus sp. PCC 7305]
MRSRSARLRLIAKSGVRNMTVQIEEKLFSSLTEKMRKQTQRNNDQKILF